MDEEGHVANYVETEQIVSYSHHRVAFVQVSWMCVVFWWYLEEEMEGDSKICEVFQLFYNCII